MAGVGREMPKYSCHKVVWALKIKAIEYGKPDTPLGASGATITPEEQGYAPFEVDVTYVRKHDPQVGGYYVIYKDGYKSFSPAEAFEDGYTPLN